MDDLISSDQYASRRTYLRKRSAFSDLLYAVNKRAQVLRRNIRVANEFNQVFNHNYSPALDFHGSIVQRTIQKWDEDRQCGCGDFGNKRSG